MFATLSTFESLFDQFRRLEWEMDQLFGAAPSSGIRTGPRGAFPPMNIGSTAEHVDVYLFAAAIDPKKLDLNIQQNLLTVVGERKAAVPEDANCYRNERFQGAFQRAISLPDDIDPDQVEARYRDGIVHVRIARRQSARPRQIEIK